jgi:xanthine dehydrogenase YagR molybdenum-binding subunit
MPKMSFAIAVGAEIANGNIRSLDSSKALKAPGVIAVITHQNRPELKPGGAFGTGGALADSRLPLADGKITYSGQYVAVIVAESLECARHAASLLKIDYVDNDPIVDFKDKRATRYNAKSWFGGPLTINRGQARDAFNSSAVKVDNIYRTPTQNHNPMETHATTSVWDGDKLTVYDATQGLYNTRKSLSDVFGVPPSNVRVICKFIGGAFGCKGAMWPHVVLSAMAARAVGRPVKLVLSRAQMFTNVGHRAETEQRVAIGAAKDGTISSIIHTGISHTSILGEFVEPYTKTTPMMYATPNMSVSQDLVKLNKGLPTFMRAPGETPGMFALESALDELAHSLSIDPIALRMKKSAGAAAVQNRVL